MEKKCCFTGHRNIRQSDEIAIKSRIKAQVASLIEKGINTFYVGGAVGFDMLAAELLIDLRDKKGADIRIISALPFPEWRDTWSENEKRRQDYIMEKSDEVFYVAKEHSREAYLSRDRKMVDESEFCIAYCTRSSGGTAYTIRYAIKKGLQVVNTADWDLALLTEKRK